MGPLYHLPDAADRIAALREAVRVLAPAGLVAVAAISRYASALDGLARGLGADQAFVRIRDRDLRDGQHRNDTGRPDYFTTAYFHRPDDLREELEAAGFEDVGVYGVEGPGWMVARFRRRWQDPALRRDYAAGGRSARTRAVGDWRERAPARHRAEADLTSSPTRGVTSDGLAARHAPAALPLLRSPVECRA